MVSLLPPRLRYSFVVLDYTFVGFFLCFVSRTTGIVRKTGSNIEGHCEGSSPRCDCRVSGMPGSSDETIQHIFLDHIDSLTAWHLRVLGFLGNPSTVLENRVERFDADYPHVLRAIDS